MTNKQVIVADKAPKAVGPYSAGIRTGNLVFTAGQIGLDRETGKMVEGGVEAQARQVLFNLQNVLESGGASLGSVVKTTVFLADMADYAKVNAIYAEYFTDTPPARSAVQVAGLPLGALVEIEAIALVEG
jgi:2-iminobutanoate/2-iminopropanoate deaminase